MNAHGSFGIGDVTNDGNKELFCHIWGNPTKFFIVEYGNLPQNEWKKVYLKNISSPFLNKISPKISHSGNIYLSWTKVENAKHYILYKCDAETFNKYTATVINVYYNSYIFINLPIGNYTFAVRAVNVPSKSNLSNIKNVSIQHSDFVKAVESAMGNTNPIFKLLIRSILDIQKNWESFLTTVKSIGSYDLEFPLDVNKSPILKILGINFKTNWSLGFNIKWDEGDQLFYFEIKVLHKKINPQFIGFLNPLNVLTKVFEKYNLNFSINSDGKILFSYNESDSTIQFENFSITISMKISKNISYIEPILRMADPSQGLATVYDILKNFLKNAISVDLDSLFYGKVSLDFSLTMTYSSSEGFKFEFVPKLDFIAISVNLNLFGDPEIAMGIYGNLIFKFISSNPLDFKLEGGIYVYFTLDLDEFMFIPGVSDLVLLLSNNGIKKHNEWKIIPFGDEETGKSINNIIINSMENDTDGDGLWIILK